MLCIRQHSIWGITISMGITNCRIIRHADDEEIGEWAKEAVYR